MALDHEVNTCTPRGIIQAPSVIYGLQPKTFESLVDASLIADVFSSMKKSIPKAEANIKTAFNSTYKPAWMIGSKVLEWTNGSTLDLLKTCWVRGGTVWFPDSLEEAVEVTNAMRGAGVQKILVDVSVSQNFKVDPQGRLLDIVKPSEISQIDEFNSRFPTWTQAGNLEPTAEADKETVFKSICQRPSKFTEQSQARYEYARDVLVRFLALMQRHATRISQSGILTSPPTNPTKQTDEKIVKLSPSTELIDQSTVIDFLAQKRNWENVNFIEYLKKIKEFITNNQDSTNEIDNIRIEMSNSLRKHAGLGADDKVLDHARIVELSANPDSANGIYDAILEVESADQNDQFAISRFQPFNQDGEEIDVDYLVRTPYGDFTSHAFPEYMTEDCPEKDLCRIKPFNPDIESRNCANVLLGKTTSSNLCPKKESTKPIAYREKCQENANTIISAPADFQAHVNCKGQFVGSVNFKKGLNNFQSDCGLAIDNEVILNENVQGTNFNIPHIQNKETVNESLETVKYLLITAVAILATLVILVLTIMAKRTRPCGYSCSPVEVRYHPGYNLGSHPNIGPLGSQHEIHGAPQNIINIHE